MGQKGSLGPAVQTIAAKMVLFVMEAEVQEERQCRQTRGEKTGRKCTGRGTRTEVHEPKQPRQDTAEEHKPATQEGRNIEVKKLNFRLKQVKNKNNLKQDYNNPESNGGSKLISTLSIVDLMYKVEDALRWDKYSNQTKTLVDKFREELKKNYLEREEAAKSEGGKRKRGMVIRRRGENGSGEGKFEPVLRDNLVQEVEQVLVSHLSKEPPPTSSTWEVGDIPKEWEIFVTGIPVSENSLDIAVREGITHVNRNKKKKMQTKSNRKHSGRYKKEPVGNNAVRHIVLQAVPIVCPEESLTSIHFEKEPETYINVTADSINKQEEWTRLGDSGGNLEDLSKMVAEVARLGRHSLWQEQSDETESGKNVQTGPEELTCNSEENLWHDAQSCRENAIEEIKCENNFSVNCNNNYDNCGEKEKYSFKNNINEEKSSLHAELELKANANEGKLKCNEENNPIKQNEKSKNKLENDRKLLENEINLTNKAIELNSTNEENILTEGENETHKDKNQVIKMLQKKVVNLQYKPFVEVKETTDSIIEKYSKNKALRIMENHSKSQDEYGLILKNEVCPNFLTSLSLYPWYKRVYVSPITGKLVGYTKRENISLRKTNTIFYQIIAYNQITREWAPDLFVQQISQIVKECLMFGKKSSPKLKIKLLSNSKKT